MPQAGHTPEIRIRQVIEQAIAKKTIEVALAAGYMISVNDGEETTLVNCTDQKAILAAMFTTDEDYLYIHAKEIHALNQLPLRPSMPKSAGFFGWVYFVYGNDGWDVISDHTTNLEGLLKPVSRLENQIEAGEFDIEGWAHV